MSETEKQANGQMDYEVVGRFLERIQGIGSAEELTRSFRDTIASMGYDTWAYQVLKVHPISREVDTLQLNTNYHPEWVAHYIDQNFAEIDPVSHASHYEQKPFHWAPLFKKIQLNQRQKQLYSECQEYGLLV